MLAVTCLKGTATSAIEAALAAPLDWTRVVELALAHRLAPPLLAALEAAAPTLVPADILAALRVHCQRLREHSEALTVELFELLDALAGRAVPVVPFKGPLLGELLFGDAAMRSAGDLDLLVHHIHVRQVREVLEARGYVDGDQPPEGPALTVVQRRLYERYQCEYLFVRPHDDMAVEPHWDLTQRTLAMDVDYPGMLDRARPARLAGREVWALAPDDLLLALCVHGAKHHWERLAWIRDVAAVLAKWPDLDLEGAAQRLRGRGCERLFLLSLEVARRCAGAALPAAVVAAIERDPSIRKLSQEVSDGLFQPGRSEPRNDRVEAFRFHLRERWSDRLRYAAMTWLTPRRRHLEAVALPRGLSWAYYPLKIGIDFAFAPAARLIKSAEYRKAVQG